MMDHKPSKSIIPAIGKILIFLPGIIFLFMQVFRSLGQSNGFLILFLIIICTIVALIGLVIYFVTEEGLKKKFKTVFIGIIFYILIFPMIWGASYLKETLYIYKHQARLESLAKQLLNGDLTIEEANEKLKEGKSVLTVICIPKERKNVLFFLNGIIDNCYGTSFSLTDERPSDNCCGDLIKWKKIKKNWYRWGTT